MDTETTNQTRQIPDSFVLSDAELAVLVKVERDLPLSQADEARLPRLLRFHLVEQDHYRPGRMVPTDWRQAELRLRQDLQEQIFHAVGDLGAVPGLLAQLKESSHRNRLADMGIEWIEGLEQVNAAITRARSASKTRVMSAQPGPRSEEALSRARDADRKLLIDRGVGLYTLYPESARQVPHQLAHVADMSRYGAKFRTTKDEFLKLVILDDEAFIPDLVDGRPVQLGGWHVRHPAVAAVFAQLFLLHWSRSTPWNGEDEPGEFNHTSEVQRRILHLMALEDLDQKQVAHRMGCSSALVNKSLAALRNDLQINTVPKLLYWWATSEDNRRS